MTINPAFVAVTRKGDGLVLKMDWKEISKKYSRKFADSKIMRTFASPLRNKALSKRVLERWQSGRLRRSWKPLCCEAPGVRIPVSPRRECKFRKVKVLRDFFFIGQHRCFPLYLVFSESDRTMSSHWQVNAKKTTARLGWIDRIIRPQRPHDFFGVFIVWFLFSLREGDDKQQVYKVCLRHGSFI